jgi:hypothetical protein
MTKLIIQTEYDVALFDTLTKESVKQPDIDPNTKVCFLDIDGVCNSGQWLDANPGVSFDEDIDPKAVERLNVIIEKTGAKIVISSSKRLRFINKPNGFNELVAFFGKRGIKNIVGATPELKGKPRYAEIEAWLNAHKVKAFVIIDDDLAAQVDGKQVKTMFETGLLDWHVEEAIKVLNEQL